MITYHVVVLTQEKVMAVVSLFPQDICILLVGPKDRSSSFARRLLVSNVLSPLTTHDQNAA